MTDESRIATSITLNRRRIMGLGAGALATVVGIGAMSRSVAHDDHTDTRATPQASPSASPMAEAAMFEIGIVDLAYTPTTLTIPANTDVTIVVNNNGKLPHDLVVSQLSLSTGRMNAGESRNLKLNVAPGSYPFYCSIRGHKQAGMVGALIAE